MMAGLKKTAAGLGLPFGDRTKTYNSRLAQELGLWAETCDLGEAFHKAAFRIYFVEGLNLASIPVLVDLARSVGLPAKEAEIVLTTRSFKDAVDRDWALSADMGIKAVPTFAVNRDLVVGARPYEALERLILNHGAIRRS